MAEIILNLLPLTVAEQEAFRAAAPEAEHRFFMGMDCQGVTRPLTDPALAQGATVVLGCLDAALVSQLTGLKWLQTWSAGVDAYLKPGVLPQGAMLTSAVGAYGPSVSEHLFAMLLTLLKKLHRYRDNQANLCWTDLEGVKSLRDATVLVAGTGDIGAKFAAMCQAMGAHTVGLKRTVDGAIPGFNQVHAIAELDAWLPRADVVCLVLPQSPETVHIMNGDRLALMKPGSVLLNGGRGSAVDPEALLTTLRSRKLWAVGLDVTEPEPLPAHSPLWQEPDLLITPHVAGGLHLEGTRERIVAIALENLKHYMAGEPLRNRMG